MRININTYIVSAHSLALTEGFKKLSHFPAVIQLELSLICAGVYSISDCALIR